jgi:hypothetical protein
LRFGSVLYQLAKKSLKTYVGRTFLMRAQQDKVRI